VPPADNRDPLPDEVETCKPFLFQQIDMIKPKVVCTSQLRHADSARQESRHHEDARAVLSSAGLFRLSDAPSAAALHQGSLNEPLREDFRKLKAFLDRQPEPVTPSNR